MQVQDKRVDDWSQANLQGAPVLVTEEAWPISPGTLSTAGPDWPGIPAGGSSTPAAQFPSWTGGQEKQELIEENPGELQEKSQTSRDSPKTAAPWASVQEGAGRTTRGSQGSWWSSPPSQGLELREEASSEQGGLEGAVGGFQEDSQTSGSGLEPVACQTSVQQRPR